ncbi:hypothetical protein, partial [Streptobacillus notomytis]|uniref:hypothetical protein n=1 Tax=Streptobacillus notomytis TaxID=1712031 RepID=UPI000AB5B406
VYSNVEYDYDSKVKLKSNSKDVNTNLFGDLEKYGEVGGKEDKRGLYGFDLNGVAKTIIGIAEEEPLSNVSGASKGTYLKSGDYFIGAKSYIDGIEKAFVEAKDDKDTKTDILKIKTEEKNGVKDIAKSSGKNAIVIGSK